MTRMGTDDTETQGYAWASQAGAAFSNPFTSELARDCENTSLSRPASGPALSRHARDQQLPRIGIQKKHGARPACRDGGGFEPRMTRIYTDKAEAQGGAWASQAGAAFSNPFTSELARDCENTSPSRSASGPAFSRAARDEWDGEREGHRVAVGLPIGEMFWESIRKLAYECLFKTAPAFVQRINPGPLGSRKPVRPYPC